MGDPLDVDIQEVPGEELEGHPSVVRKVEQVDSVYRLLHRNQNVDHSEVILQPVTDEDASTVNQEPELLIRRLERGQMF